MRHCRGIFGYNGYNWKMPKFRLIHRMFKGQKSSIIYLKCIPGTDQWRHQCCDAYRAMSGYDDFGSYTPPRIPVPNQEEISCGKFQIPSKADPLPLVLRESRSVQQFKNTTNNNKTKQTQHAISDRYLASPNHTYSHDYKPLLRWIFSPGTWLIITIRGWYL